MVLQLEMLFKFCAVFILISSSQTKAHLTSPVQQINQLVNQWAPLIWMAPEEKFFPVSVDKYLKNVQLADESGGDRKDFFKLSDVFQPNDDSSSMFLVTRSSLEKLKENETSILSGENPAIYNVPVYVVIQMCSPHISFHSSEVDTIKNDINLVFGKIEQNLVFSATFWTFYPYNNGKEVCFLGNVPTLTLFGTCFGHLKTIGSHVGDWERVTLFFNGNLFPSEMFLSVHDTGGYYTYDKRRQYFKFDAKRVKKRAVQKPKFPSIVRMQRGRPVLFSANGSHGLWGAPGDHEYVKIPKLTDKCGYGVPWKTWENLIVFELDDYAVPNWLFYKGKWGNPSNNCVFFKKLGLCEHVDGPRGIIRQQKDFNCS